MIFTLNTSANFISVNITVEIIIIKPNKLTSLEKPGFEPGRATCNVAVLPDYTNSPVIIIIYYSYIMIINYEINIFD